MGYSKRQFIAAAYDEIGMAGYVFDLTPEELQAALRRLDAMMAEWNGKGIRVGYPIPASPEDSDLDEPSEVPDSANEAIITNLGIRLAPKHGKTVSPDTKIIAKQAYNTVLSRACFPPQMQMPGSMPSGAGNKPQLGLGNTFLTPPVDTIDAGPDSAITFD